MDSADSLLNSDHDHDSLPPLLYDPSSSSSKNYMRRMQSVEQVEKKKRIKKERKNKKKYIYERPLIKNLQFPKSDDSFKELKDLRIKVNNDLNHYTPLFLQKSVDINQIDYSYLHRQFDSRVKSQHQKIQNSLVNAVFRKGYRYCHICHAHILKESSHFQRNKYRKQHRKIKSRSKANKYIQQLVDKVSNDRISKLIQGVSVPKINKQEMMEIIQEENKAKQMKRKQKKVQKVKKIKKVKNEEKIKSAQRAQRVQVAKKNKKDRCAGKRKSVRKTK